eukprot:TRINITY_DN10874_c0_g1_i11.p1 TRINITY_DN10874_c0_g1~~TRINITY_DN10874_c0_g1_i11.p1  ORF type:complete len:153 (-),score=16.52 TRINITY_DN10874_c0_g1_i11:148-606(-)
MCIRDSFISGNAVEGIPCELCKWTYNAIFNIITSDICTLQTNIALSIIRVGWRLFCPAALGFSLEVCEQFYENVCVLMGTNLLRRFDGEVLCPKLGLCNNPIIVPADFNEFRRKILLDKPPRVYPDASISDMKFAVITDLHVDLAYSTVLTQ